MIYPSPVNDPYSGLIVTYNRVKFGPNWFMVYYKNVATPCLTVKEVRSRFGTAKFTPTVSTLTEWCKDMIDKYDTVKEEQDMAGIIATGFGPESHLDPTDPNYQTRTVI